MSLGGLSKSRLERMHQVLSGYVERKEMPGLVALNVHRHSEAPAAIRTEKDFGPCALLRRELI